MISTHPCLLQGCREQVRRTFLTCPRCWSIGAPELKAELRKVVKRIAPMSQALIRFLADLHSRAELIAVPAPLDHAEQGVTGGCSCRSCSSSLAAALRRCDATPFAWASHWWRRQLFPEIRLEPEQQARRS